MPTYEYQCKKCAHKFEASQKITEEPLKECPVCGAPVQRLISAGVGFIFKGSGFYATDYRSKEYKQKQKQEKKSSQGSCPASGDSQACKKCPKNIDPDK
ncbi:MAG: zinc ribbon domain-containing protein [Candidatus Omnitrophica bacterium]|nr:zinc ribbon domain-containing protein [Candidatus Omnitrophota bacterium]